MIRRSGPVILAPNPLTDVSKERFCRIEQNEAHRLFDDVGVEFDAAITRSSTFSRRLSSAVKPRFNFRGGC
jgi:hypothetical protein